jgi:hypothetical protein
MLFTSVFLDSGFFHLTTYPGPNREARRRFRIFSNIRGVIRFSNWLFVMNTPGSQLESHGQGNIFKHRSHVMRRLKSHSRFFRMKIVTCSLHRSNNSPMSKMTPRWWIHRKASALQSCKNVSPVMNTPWGLSHSSDETPGSLDFALVNTPGGTPPRRRVQYGVDYIYCTITPAGFSDVKLKKYYSTAGLGRPHILVWSVHQRPHHEGQG